jgi:CDGSH-type Zn-finger protein
MPADEPKIVVSKNGPYIVKGGIPIAVEIITPNDQDGSWEWVRGRAFETKPIAALCRCGHSQQKPFCDATHKKVNFDGTETATRKPYDEQACCEAGAALDLFDAEALCAGARFCDNFGSAWNLVKQSDKPRERDLLIHEVVRCPSGRLVLRDKATGQAIEPQLSPSIAVVEDPQKRCAGPLWVRGGVAIESADGTPYERRNRVTLCRCGASQNKPFCDGSHLDAGFTDDLMTSYE